MVRIAPIRLAFNPKTLWFDAGDLELHKGEGVVVTTARGLEFGHLAEEVFDATDDQIKKLKTPLKPVTRLATEADVECAEDMRRRSDEALPIFKEMVAEANSDMRPVSVEFLLDGDKAIFYFEAEERVDFRDLVRKLAARFHVRIDMRQIGVRDEARMVGGLGHCGQELCCKRLGGEFNPVSIRMAKEQDLSLNPQKISGVCGRLMCCLRYEFDAYKDFKSRAPKYNAQVETPLGKAKVVDLDVPREVISLKIDGEKPVKVPLADFEPPQEGCRPNCVCKAAWENATQQASLAIAGETTFLTSQFTEQDKLADPASVRRTGSGGKGISKGRANSATNATPKAAENTSASSESRKPRRRRSTKVAADGTTQSVVTEESSANRKQKPAQNGNSQQKKQNGGRKQGQHNSKKNQGQRNGDQAQASPDAKKNGSRPASGAGKSGGPRPGQRSSALRQQHAAAGSESASSSPSTHAGRSAGEGDSRQRRRRRSHRAGGSEGQGGAGNQGAGTSSGGSHEA